MVLDDYKSPIDPQYPVVCIDKTLNGVLEVLR